MHNKSGAIGSAMGVVLPNIFMVELERTIIPSLSDKIKLGKPYIGHRIAFVEIDEVKNVLSFRNNYHSNIQFTMEIVKNNQIPFSFLYIFLIRNVEANNSDIYINGKSFAPKNWKQMTLKR